MKPTIEAFGLDQANVALARSRKGRLTGAAVLVPGAAGDYQ
jgi:hypothetical protein